jgi:hypothetical protein
MSNLFPPTGLLIARTVTLRPVSVTQLGAAFSTVYTVPAGKVFVVEMLHVVNTDILARTIRVCLDGDTTAHAVIWDMTLVPNDFTELLKGHIIDTGVTVRAMASAAGVVNVILSGWETTQ